MFIQQQRWLQLTIQKFLKEKQKFMKTVVGSGIFVQEFKKYMSSVGMEHACGVGLYRSQSNISAHPLL